MYMTNILTILTWFTSKKAYLAPYAEDEDVQKIAKKLWNSVDGNDWIPFVIMFVFTIAICWYYYFPFNNKPGRHYHPKYWGWFGFGSIVLTFFMTIGCFYFMAKSPGFNIMLLIKAAVVNTLYAAMLYIGFSYFINKTGKSNAYPFPF